MRRLFSAAFVLPLLVLLCWPKEAWVSGAMSASAVSQNYAISISELSYAFGDDPPPSPEWLESQARSWRERLAEIMTLTDEWLASEIRERRIAPVEITLDTVPVEAPAKTQQAQELSRSALIALPSCKLEQRNQAVVVRLALRAVPSSAARTALSESLCARLLAANRAPVVPVALEIVSPLQANRDGLALALEANFSVPKKLLSAVNRTRADYFKKASDVMVQASHRFEKAHPGVSLRRSTQAGGNLVRFFMDGPFGGFDLLTDVVVAPGAKRPTDVELKNALYHEWQAAGLPVQVGLHALVSPSSH